MREILIFEQHGHKVQRAFKITVAELCDKGARRSIQHREGFRNAEIHRAFAPGNKIRNCNDKIWYKVHLFDDDFGCIQSVFAEQMKEQGKTLPVEPEDGSQMLVYKNLHDIIRINGMPHFFAYIGYDYAKRKFLQGSEVLKHELLQQEANNGTNH